jgi:hypothetical protein
MEDDLKKKSEMEDDLKKNLIGRRPKKKKILPKLLKMNQNKNGRRP